MNPSAKAAGLSLQLSSPIESRDGSMFEHRSDLRPHDDGPAKKSFARTSIAKARESARAQTAKYFTRRQFPHRNLASIRFSRYIAVCSGSEATQSAFTYADYTRGRRVPYGLSGVRLRFLPSAKAGGFLGATTVNTNGQTTVVEGRRAK